MTRCLVLAFLLLSFGGVSPAATSPRARGEERVTWVQFYHFDLTEGRLRYYYDPTSIRRRNDILAAQWRVTSSRFGTTTLYSIDIACRAGRFTETGTVLIDRDGRARTLPPAELLQDQVIRRGTSGDVFRRAFCR